MMGYMTYLKSTEAIRTLGYEEVAKKVNTATITNILEAITKETWTNGIGELLLKVKGSIITKTNNSTINNIIYTDVYWYYVADEKLVCYCEDNETAALKAALIHLDKLCDSFNIDDKEILIELISEED